MNNQGLFKALKKDIIFSILGINVLNPVYKQVPQTMLFYKTKKEGGETNPKLGFYRTAPFFSSSKYALSFFVYQLHDLPKKKKKGLPQSPHLISTVSFQIPSQNTFFHIWQHVRHILYVLSTIVMIIIIHHYSLTRRNRRRYRRLRLRLRDTRLTSQPTHDPSHTIHRPSCIPPSPGPGGGRCYAR